MKSWQWYVALAIAVLSAGIGVVMGMTPEELGIHKVTMRWLPVIMAMLNVLQGFLPKLQGESEPPAPPPKSGIGGFGLVLALAAWLVAGPAMAQAPVVKQTAILPWRTMQEERYRQQQIEREVQRQLQQQHQQAPQQDNTPHWIALISQLLKQQPQVIYVPMPSQQQLPIAGHPQQALPIAGQPQQQLPIAGQPQQALPIQGQPQQALPPGGQPQQQLPIAGQPQASPQAAPPSPIVIPPAAAPPAPAPTLPQGTPAPGGQPQQKLPTGTQRYVPALYRR